MKRLYVFLLFALPMAAAAQDDLLKELEQSQKPEVEYIEQTFKGTRLVNGQTIETKGKGELEFIFAHRFGPMTGGWYQLFGLDEAQVRLGLEYGITDRLGIGIGRFSEDKTMDYYGRLKVLKQSRGARVMPVTVTLFSQVAAKMSPKGDDDPKKSGVNRLSYTSQALIARKFNQNLSLQLMPTFNHRNTVDTSDYHDTYAVGVGGRYKITRSMAVTAEYYHRVNVHPENTNTYNPFGVGFEIETGGHVFQIVATNARGLTERAWLTETAGNFWAGEICLGFNITRTFQIVKRK
jgi:hypothetical protein